MSMECITNSSKNVEFVMSKYNITRSIDIPNQVRVEQSPGLLTITGPLGYINLNLSKMDPKGQIAYKQENNQLHINSASPALTGLWCGRFNSIFYGVTRGHSVSLTLRGIGYRARVEGQDIYLKVGTSHDTLYRVPEGIRVYSPDPVTLILFGVDASQVNQVGASLVHLRKPSAYQLKGIYKTNGIYRRKAGKRK